MAQSAQADVLEYTRARQDFGWPIGKAQVLSHRFDPPTEGAMLKRSTSEDGKKVAVP